MPYSIKREYSEVRICVIYGLKNVGSVKKYILFFLTASITNYITSNVMRVEIISTTNICTKNWNSTAHPLINWPIHCRNILMSSILIPFVSQRIHGPLSAWRKVFVCPINKSHFQLQYIEIIQKIFNGNFDIHSSTMILLFFPTQNAFFID